jgi:hypothetical protein
MLPIPFQLRSQSTFVLKFRAAMFQIIYLVCFQKLHGRRRKGVALAP